MSVVQGSGRPVKGYRLESGDRVPSVTTITGRFKESGGLIWWAWNEGIEGRDFRASRDKAAEAGSIAHGWIEDWIHGREWVDPFAETQYPPNLTEIEQALQGYAAFKEWAEQVKLEILETETPLVSEHYRYGGTFDAVALIAGVPKLLDWKTSNAVYGEYVVQVAAYRQLLRERVEGYDGVPLIKVPSSAQLLRFGKDHADFHAHSYPESVLDMGWAWFEHARQMYDLDKELKKVAA